MTKTEDKMRYEPYVTMTAICEAYIAMRDVLAEVEGDPRRQRYSADSYLPEHLRERLRAAMDRCGAVVK